ncbi:MAG: fasciclin domain-containing protein [Erythrobacter sp.]|nr:fasciclin domain-containing protein [Erythrobacter sp.]NCQ63138.1 fasciclin domain-containing protein [Alphaproteobacteria bacterium]
MKITIAPALATLCLLLAGCGGADSRNDAERVSTTEGDNSLAVTIGEIPELSTANGIISNAGLEDPFNGAGSYTIFLPDNAAFARLPKEELDRLESADGRSGVIAILRTHIATGVIAPEDLDGELEVNGGTFELTSVADEPMIVREVDGRIVVGEGDDAPHLTGVSRSAANGVVYVLDGFIPGEGRSAVGAD